MEKHRQLGQRPVASSFKKLAKPFIGGAKQMVKGAGQVVRESEIARTANMKSKFKARPLQGAAAAKHVRKQFKKPTY